MGADSSFHLGKDLRCPVRQTWVAGSFLLKAERAIHITLTFARRIPPIFAVDGTTGA
jgi:hypothetical protein